MDGRVRVLRGVGAATASTALALGFHLAGGGAAPGPLGLLVPLILSCVGASAMMSRSPRLLTTMAAACLAQVVFHVSFSLGAVATGSTAVISAIPGGHHHGGAEGAAEIAAVVDRASHGGGVEHSMLHGDVRMWSMHLVAAIVTALVLHRGEVLGRWLVAFGRAAVAAVLPATPLLVEPGEGPRVVVCAPVDVLRLLLLTRVVPGRAPPLGLAA